MDTGRELDRLVAEKVLGESFRPHNGFDVNGFGFIRTPNYSTDIAAAWQVAEKLFALGYEVRISLNHDDYFLMECVITKPGWKEDQDIVATGHSTMPLAICLAALKTVGVKP